VLCSYVWSNLDVGYIQGMCDLLAPLMVVFDDGTVWIQIVSPVCVAMCTEQDSNAGDNCLAECRSQKLPNHNFRHFWSSEQHYTGTRRLARFYFLVVYYSGHRSARVRRAEINRCHNTIWGTSCHWRSMQMVPIDSQVRLPISVL